MTELAAGDWVEVKVQRHLAHPHDIARTVMVEQWVCCPVRYADEDFLAITLDGITRAILRVGSVAWRQVPRRA
jgi:hypothetical protein